MDSSLPGTAGLRSQGVALPNPAHISPLPPLASLRRSRPYASYYQESLAITPPSTLTLAVRLAKDLGAVAKSNAILGDQPSPFDTAKQPSISLEDYFVRIAKFTRCSVEAQVIAIVYLDRLFAETEIFATAKNIYRQPNQSVPHRFSRRHQVPRRPPLEQRGLRQGRRCPPG